MGLPEIVTLNKLKRIRENKTVRFILLPLAQLQGKFRLWRYQNSEYAQYIKSLKNTHAGERCFVIGNGPSLRPEDLDDLDEKNIACFGSNRIYRIYPKTAWRPTYYLCMDRYVAESEHDQIVAIGDYPKFLDYKDAKRWEKDPNVHYLCTENRFIVDLYSVISIDLSEDLSKCCSRITTVTVSAIELAIYMGYSEIFLLGVDNNYTHRRNPDGTIFVDPTVQSSYFPGGEPDKSAGVAVQPFEQVNESYKMAKKFAEEHGVKIYNATRGGKLEVFERVDFDDVVGK